MCLLTIYMSEHCLHWITSLCFCFFHLNIFSNFPCIFWFHFFFFFLFDPLVVCVWISKYLWIFQFSFYLPNTGDIRDAVSTPGSERSPGGENGNPPPPPVFLPGKSHEQRSLVGYRSLGCKESDITWRLNSITQAFKILKWVPSNTNILCIFSGSSTQLLTSPHFKSFLLDHQIMKKE